MPPIKGDAAKDLRLMPCEAGGRSYYLDATRIRSVYRKEEWRLNWRSESPLGWIRHGGAEVPILDLARALGVAHSNVAGSAVVVDTEDGLRAWGVGSVGRVAPVPAGRLLPVPGPCWGEASPPWMGVMAGGGESPALCLSPQHLGGAVRLPPRSIPAAATAPSEGPKTGRAILFAAFPEPASGPMEVRFCFGFGQVAEYCTLPKVIPVPAGPPWLAGLMVWRDRSVPVVDLCWGVTGRPSSAAAEDYLVVRATPGGLFAALTVWGRPEAVELPLDCDVEPAPAVAHPRWFQAAFRRGRRLILTPGFGAILEGDV